MSVEPIKPLYEARGLEVWKLPQERVVGDRTHISLGFCACKVSEWLDEDGAKNIAQMLDFAERATEPDTEKLRLQLVASTLLEALKSVGRYLSEESDDSLLRNRTALAHTARTAITLAETPSPEPAKDVENAL